MQKNFEINNAKLHSFIRSLTFAILYITGKINRRQASIQGSSINIKYEVFGMSIKFIVMVSNCKSLM